MKQSSMDNIQQDHSSSKTKISNFASRSEKTSWTRKRTNLATFITNKVNPIEQQIVDLQTQLVPIYDEMKEMRDEMVATCIHPWEDLRTEDDGVRCTFCGKKMVVPTISQDEIEHE